MRNTKTIIFFIAGILSALLMAGCLNPISVEPLKSAGSINDAFTVNIMIGKDGRARSVIGPDEARIKGDIRNIIQLVVVDKATKQITAFDEVRRANDAEKDAELNVDPITFGQSYYFMVLTGHWERDYVKETANGNGNYVYKDANPPTLMAAGLTEQLITGDGKVSVKVCPLVADAKFETANAGVPAAIRAREAAVSAGKPGKAILLPVDWNVTWTVKQGTSGNGFAELIKAQKAVNDTAGDELLIKGGSSIIRGTGLGDLTSGKPKVAGNVITLPLGPEYTKGIKRIGTEGSVNFNLEYVPFNLTDGTKWGPYKGVSAFDLNGKAPVWIIRNGVNDLAQDSGTDFNNLGKKGYTDPGKTGLFANGNGAVSFRIAGAAGPGDKEFPGFSALKLTKGEFKGPANAANPKIKFTTEGYSGTAEAYYVVTGKTDPAPAYSAYTGSLGGLAAGTYEKEVTVPSAGGKYYVYVVLFKDGNLSNGIKYDTATGSVKVEMIW